MENLTRFHDIIYEFTLRFFNLLDQVVNFSWLFIEFSGSLCATREKAVFGLLQKHMKYTLSKTKRWENIIYHYYFSFSRLYLFIFGWKLVITEKSSYHKAHDQNAMRLVIIQSIKQGQLKSCHSCSITKAVLKNSQYLQENICVEVSF